MKMRHLLWNNDTLKSVSLKKNCDGKWRKALPPAIFNIYIYIYIHTRVYIYIYDVWAFSPPYWMICGDTCRNHAQFNKPTCRTIYDERWEPYIRTLSGESDINMMCAEPRLGLALVMPWRTLSLDTYGPVYSRPSRLWRTRRPLTTLLQIEARDFTAAQLIMVMTPRSSWDLAGWTISASLSAKMTVPNSCPKHSELQDFCWTTA